MALVYTNRFLAALLLLLYWLCLHAAANFYIVVSQDVVTIAVVLEMHACVGRDQHLSFMLLAIPTEASARMCFDFLIFQSVRTYLFNIVGLINCHSKSN